MQPWFTPWLQLCERPGAKGIYLSYAQTPDTIELVKKMSVVFSCQIGGKFCYVAVVNYYSDFGKQHSDWLQ